MVLPAFYDEKRAMPENGSYPEQNKVCIYRFSEMDGCAAMAECTGVLYIPLDFRYYHPPGSGRFYFQQNHTRGYPAF
ncbi:hypothetical protein AS589_13035 [Empedobacter brevis]|nr:hypothetical protein AS589_13035 [Empedobacter brevis]